MVPDDVADGRPDTLFALVCGLYLAAVVGTLAVVLARGSTDDPALLYVGLLTVLASVTVGGTLAVRRVSGLAGTLGGTRLAWWIAVGPAVLGLVPIGLRETDLVPVPTSVVVLGAFGGLIVGTLGFVVVSVAMTRWVASETADATVHATWRAPWPQRDRRLVLGLGVALLGLGVVGLGVGIASAQQLVRTVAQMAIPLGAVVATAGRTRTYRATDRGLEIRHPVARRLVPWSRIRGYRVTSDAIRLRSSRPGSPGWRFDRTAIPDEAAVRSALDRYLAAR